MVLPAARGKLGLLELRLLGNLAVVCCCGRRRSHRGRRRSGRGSCWCCIGAAGELDLLLLRRGKMGVLDAATGLPSAAAAAAPGSRAGGETPGVVWQGEEAGWKVEKDDGLG